MRTKALTSLGPRRRKRYIQRPLLPAYILVCLAEEIGLPPLLLEKLDDELATAALLMCAFNRAHECNRSLVDEGLEVYIVDCGKCEVEKVSGERGYGGEVAVEEDGV
jgi:hypothetical protein